MMWLCLLLLAASEHVQGRRDCVLVGNRMHGWISSCRHRKECKGVVHGQANTDNNGTERDTMFTRHRIPPEADTTARYTLP